MTPEGSGMMFANKGVRQALADPEIRAEIFRGHPIGELVEGNWKFGMCGGN